MKSKIVKHKESPTHYSEIQEGIWSIFHPEEVLFTANALITLPPVRKRFEDLDISPSLYDALEEVLGEDQIFWYDHPIQIGVEPDKNEILYGLRHLSEALHYEKELKNVANDAEITCVLSASVTHEGLQEIVKEYIEYELKKDLYYFIFRICKQKKYFAKQIRSAKTPGLSPST